MAYSHHNPHMPSDQMHQKIWGKAEWLSSSPDLILIENLSSILEDTMWAEKDQAKEYCRDLETALDGRKKIKQETLGNPVKSMSDRVGDIVKNTGYYESNSFEIYIFLTWDRHIKGVLLSFTS